MAIEERLQQIQTQIEQAKTRRIQAETRLEAQEARRNDLLTECQRLGVNPSALQETIDALEREIAQGVEDLERQLSAPLQPQAEISLPTPGGDLPF